MLKENLDHLKASGFGIERTPTGYTFTIGPRDDSGSLHIGKEECEVIQKIGKILEIRVLEGSKLRLTVLHAIIGTG